MSRTLNFAHAQARSFTHLTSLAVAAILFAALVAVPAFASTPRVEVLCEGDCSSLPDVGPTPSGGAFDFELGLKGQLNDFNLFISTPGNVFIQGPVVGNESVILDGLDIQLNGLEITTADLDLRGSVLDPPSGSLIPPSEEDEGELSIPILAGGAQSLPWVKFSSDGDIYLNLSMSSLGQIKVVAGGSIVGNPVPEPGTAILFGLGLAGLASVRRS